MKRYLSLLLVLVMICALLSGCGEKRKLLGTWECTVDLAETAKHMLDQLSLGESFEIPNLVVSSQLTFSKDNTFRLAPDEQSLADAVAQLKQSLADNLLEILREQLSEKGLPVDITALLEQSNLNLDALTQQLFDVFDEESFVKALSQQLTLEGFFQVKGDKLLLSAEAEETLDEHYVLYTLKGDALTFTEMVGTSSFLEDYVLLKTLPLSFTKLS